MNTLSKAMSSTYFKAAMACRKIRDDVIDEDVIDLYKYCTMYKENFHTFKTIMANVHGIIDIKSFDEWDPTIVAFYDIMNHHVIRQLEIRDLTVEEIPEYRYGLGRNLLCLARLIECKIINTAKMRYILNDLLDPINIGVSFDDYLMHSDKFNDEDDSSIVNKIIAEVIEVNPTIVAEYKSGKEKVIGSLIGQVMKRIKADPTLIKEMLLREMK